MPNKQQQNLSSNHLGNGTGETSSDPAYWKSVIEQLNVRLAKIDLSDLHAKMLVRQIEKLEQRKLARAEQDEGDNNNDHGGKLRDENQSSGGTGEGVGGKASDICPNNIRLNTSEMAPIKTRDTLNSRFSFPTTNTISAISLLINFFIFSR